MSAPRGLSQALFCLQVYPDMRMYLASTSTSKTHPGLMLKATLDWRSEGHDGSLSQLPPSSPAADTPSQRQKNKPGGAQPFKPAHGGAGDMNRALNRALLHAHIKGVAGCCIDLVTLGYDLPALAINSKTSLYPSKHS